MCHMSMKMNILVCFIISISVVESLKAGQLRVVPVKELINQSHLIAIIEIKNVQTISMDASGNKVLIHLAQAHIERTFKSDRPKDNEHKTIPIVSSSIPLSTAVWRPLKKQRYLAFLKPQQGHYVFDMKIAFREIDENNKVMWYDLEGPFRGEIKFQSLPVEIVTQKIHSLLKTPEK